MEGEAIDCPFPTFSKIDTIHSFLLQQQSNREDHKYTGKSA
jgi:hypothetical protein